MKAWLGFRDCKDSRGEEGAGATAGVPRIRYLRQGLYGGSNRFEDYEHSIPVNDEKKNLERMDSEVARKLDSYTVPKSVLENVPRGTGEDLDEVGLGRPQRSFFRADEYKRNVGIF